MWIGRTLLVAVLLAAAPAMAIDNNSFGLDEESAGSTTTSVPGPSTSSSSLTSTTTSSTASTSSTSRPPTTSTTATSTTTTSSTTLPPSSGLVAAYRFEETGGTALVDASGNGMTGTLGGATRTTAGKCGRAIDTTDGVALAPPVDVARTIEAWVRPTSFGGWRCFASNRRDSATTRHFYVCTEGSFAAAGHRADSGWVDARGGTVPEDEWSHIALTFGADGRLHIYLNGKEVGSRTSGLPGNATIDLRIGETYLGERWQGQVDELRVYSRALTAAEIQADMACPGGAPTTTTLPPASTTSTSSSITTTSSTTTSTRLCPWPQPICPAFP